MNFFVIRLGKTSVEDIKAIDSNKTWDQTARVLSIKCKQVPSDFSIGSFALLWLGSDNSKGAETDWVQGLRAIAKITNFTRGASHNDDSTIELSISVTFPDTVTKDLIFDKASIEYAECRNIPVIGINAGAQQTVLKVDPNDANQSISALFAALMKIHPDFKSKVESSYLELASLFSYIPKKEIREIVVASLPQADLHPGPDLLKNLIRSYMKSTKSCGVQTELSTCINLFASFISKKFLILAGLSGSGKTKSSQAFIQWICQKHEGDGVISYKLIPVGADWTSNENVLGYPDGIKDDRYVITPALDLILRAEKDEKRPYFLILDEMNLSHVERYFADILSAIESEEPIPLYEGKPRYAYSMDKEGVPGEPGSRRKIPQELNLPKNLFIIGTVNVDETTYQFSSKVLDRANVIEFRMASDDMRACLENPVTPKLNLLAGQGVEFGEAFVQAASSLVVLENPIKSAFAAEMQRFFTTLKTHNAEFGYRTAHEAARFVHFYRVLGNHPADDLKAADKEFDAASGEFKPVTSGQTWFDSAMDTVVIQKLLPKLHGSRSKLENLLIDLALLCAWDVATHAGKLTAGEGEKKPTKSSSSLLAETQKTTGFKPRYPRSFEKLERMLTKLRRDQFVSFSEA